MEFRDASLRPGISRHLFLVGQTRFSILSCQPFSAGARAPRFFFGRRFVYVYYFLSFFLAWKVFGAHFIFARRFATSAFFRRRSEHIFGGHVLGSTLCGIHSFMFRGAFCCPF